MPTHDGPSDDDARLVESHPFSAKRELVKNFNIIGTALGDMQNDEPYPGYFIALRDAAGAQDLNVATPIAIAWNIQTALDTDEYTHSISVNNSRITIDNGGLFKISFNISALSATAAAKNIRARLRIDGSVFTSFQTFGYAADSTDGDLTLVAANVILAISASSYIEVMVDGVGTGIDSAACNTIANASHIYVERIR